MFVVSVRQKQLTGTRDERSTLKKGTAQNAMSYVERLEMFAVFADG